MDREELTQYLAEYFGFRMGKAEYFGFRMGKNLSSKTRKNLKTTINAEKDVKKFKNF